MMLWCPPAHRVHWTKAVEFDNKVCKGELNFKWILLLKNMMYKNRVILPPPLWWIQVTGWSWMICVPGWAGQTVRPYRARLIWAGQECEDELFNDGKYSERIHPWNFRLARSRSCLCCKSAGQSCWDSPLRVIKTQESAGCVLAKHTTHNHVFGARLCKPQHFTYMVYSKCGFLQE